MLNTLISYSSYNNILVLPFVNTISFAVFIATTLFIISLILNQTRSTRINHQNAQVRQHAQTSIISLYKL